MQSPGGEKSQKSNLNIINLSNIYLLKYQPKNIPIINQKTTLKISLFINKEE